LNSKDKEGLSFKRLSLYVKGFGAAAVRKSAARKNFADY
jgi:hypothetical protein